MRWGRQQQTRRSYFWAIWRGSWRAMGAVAVGEAALGPEEAGEMDIVVHQPQTRAQRARHAKHDRRKRKRRFKQVW